MLRVFTGSRIVQSRIQIIHNFTHNYKYILPYDKFGNHMYNLQDTQFLINSSRGHFYQSNIRAIHSRGVAYSNTLKTRDEERTCSVLRFLVYSWTRKTWRASPFSARSTHIHKQTQATVKRVIKYPKHIAATTTMSTPHLLPLEDPRIHGRHTLGRPDVIAPHVAQRSVCYDSAMLRGRQYEDSAIARITCRYPSDGHSFFKNSEVARSSGEKIGLPLLPYARVLIRANRCGCMFISTITTITTTTTHDFSQK
ncbi:unnamed protein product [Trichogramma brassicae]|uniref:Uncharacterized protein n=1 Tax=Trichogramma brassicae TaxID=86971 RepID=A0A6H5IPP1_9HYME|nr:unnamed protein product [Trichogramma brassicae]